MRKIFRWLSQQVGACWEKTRGLYHSLKWWQVIGGICLAIPVIQIEYLAIGLAAITGPVSEGKPYSPQLNLALGILYFTLAAFGWFFFRESVFILAGVQVVRFVRDFSNRWVERYHESSPEGCESHSTC